MNEEAAVDFGRLLRDSRLAAGLTQEALAERASMGVRSLQALERGESKPFRDTLQRLIGALDLAPEAHASFIAAATPSPRRRAPAAASSAVAPPAARPRDHPPRQAPSPAPAWRLAQLPAPLTTFVGREQEQVEIAHLLEQIRLLTLTGPGGTGKTRLAIQVAATMRARFADGVAFVSLASITDPALLAVTVATTLEVQQGDDPSLTHSLVSCLRTRRFLLVLDNFEHVVAAAPLVTELLAGCPTLHVLVTSRMPLHLSGEQEYAVPPLPLPPQDAGIAHDADHVARNPAVALFVQRARLVRPAFALTGENAPVVGEICRRLDGLPLAIELAAARIKLLAPADLLGRLGERLQVLKGGPHDLPERQQTLRGAMDWSYDLLSMAEQTLFWRLAVFSGGWTLEAAEAVCRGDGLDGEVLDILGSLTDKSLLVVEMETDGHGETRYGMLETIRAYALERLVSRGEGADLQRRHARYFEQLAARETPELYWTNNTAWLAWTEREQGNLRAALQWAHGYREVEMEMRLMVPLIGFWYAHGRLHEAHDQLERLHGLHESNRDLIAPDLLIRALGALGIMLWLRGEYGRARALAEECLARCRAADLAPYRSTTAFHILGHIACDMGDYARAETLFQELLARARAAGDTLDTARALLGLSDVARGRGDADQLAARCTESLALSRDAGDESGVGYALHNLGVAAYLQHDLPRASALLARSLALFRERDCTTDVAEVLTSAGRVARAEGRLGEARSAFVESLALTRPSGPFFVVLDDLEELAGIAAAVGHGKTAARLFGVVAALRGASGILPTATHWARRERDMAHARAALGAAAFEADYEAGQAMRLEAAINLALEASLDAAVVA